MLLSWIPAFAGMTENATQPSFPRRRESRCLPLIIEAKVVVIPYLGGLTINVVATPCFVHVRQDREGSVTLTALQLRDGLHREELSYVASMHEVTEGEGMTKAIPVEVMTLLMEYADAMPDELSSIQPPKHDIDHTIELVPRAVPPA